MELHDTAAVTNAGTAAPPVPGPTARQRGPEASVSQWELQRVPWGAPLSPSARLSRPHAEGDLHVKRLAHTSAPLRVSSCASACVL